MKLGLFPNMPEAEYRAIPAVNASALKHGRRSLAHMRHAMMNPSEPSPAMAMGTAVHMAILEPERFVFEYAICDRAVDRRSRHWAEFCSIACDGPGGKIPLTKPDGDAVYAMVAAVQAHPDAAPLLAAPGQCEYVAVWQDADTGLACKARLDKYVPGAIALDIKTTRNASPETFERDVYTLGYWQQVAWYREGFERASGKPTPFTIIAVENEPPHCVAVYSLDDDTLARGVAENHSILKRYAEALKTGTFPGYPHPSGPIEIGMPDWAKKRHIPEAMSYATDDTGGF